MGGYFYKLEKVTKDALKHIFDKEKFCGAWFKRKEFIDN